jgi:hypothetical protein
LEIELLVSSHSDKKLCELNENIEAQTDWKKDVNLLWVMMSKNNPIELFEKVYPILPKREVVNP